MTANPCLVSVAELTHIAERARDAGKRVVHCHGVFDLLHIGHIRYFEQARQFGDVLVVTVTPDRFVDKGPGRPAFPENLRAEAVVSLACVDWVAINEWPTAQETLRALRPDIYVKGSEFKELAADPTGKIALEAAVVQEVGAELRFTEDIVFSSSNLINRYLSTLPDEIDEYLRLFRKRHTLDQVLEVIERMQNLRVAVVGDTILDEYQYGEAIGKSSKDPTLVLKYRSRDLFAGGILSVANQVARFSGPVSLFSRLGERDSHEAFVRENLADTVTPHFVTQPDAPTLIKRRFIDGYSFNKLLEMYVMDDSPLPPHLDARLCGLVREQLAECDLAIVADFGHGAISDALMEAICEAAPFLALNVQANAGNRGFHTVAQYPRADYVCIAEHEIRLEMRDRRGEVHPLMDRVAENVGCSRIVVTRGRRGCILREGDGQFLEIPAFAERVVDRVGAGDAFLSVTALAAVLEAPPEIMGFIGNVVGALAVGVIGNQKAVDRPGVRKYVTALLK